MHSIAAMYITYELKDPDSLHKTNEVTAISGREVGMDATAIFIRVTIGGNFIIQSESGKVTNFYNRTSANATLCLTLLDVISIYIHSTITNIQHS